MSTSAEIEKLRDLLDVAETNQLDLLERRILELEQEIQRMTKDTEFRSSYIAEVLPAAVDKRGGTNRTLSKSLQPHVVESIGRSARTEPDNMAAALYPVLGPAIRKMVASYFTFESKTASRPEQVFLIEPDSGRVVRHVSMEHLTDSSSGGSDESDVISGMLEAIRSFVQDSFDAADHDGMRELSVGEITIMVEWGPAAILACVVRGVGTEDYRTAIRQSLETIHTQFAEELASYEGDPETMTATEPMLISLLTYEAENRGPEPTSSSPWRIVWIAMVLIAAAVVTFTLIGR